MNKSTGLQKSIDQIGLETVTRYLPKGMKLHNCEMHGMYASHYKETSPLCPICPSINPEGNGTTASQVELFIDLKDAIGHNTTNTDNAIQDPTVHIHPLGV